MHRYAGPTARRTGSNRTLFVAVPLSALALSVLALILGRSLLASPSPGAGLTAQPLASQPTTPSTTRPVTPVAVTLKDLGVARGTLTVRAPARTPKSAFVVVVLDGPRRVLKTDARAPFAVTVNTKALPDGRYTVTVLVARKGRTSTASTSTVVVRNAPKPKPTATTPGGGTSGRTGGGTDSGGGGAGSGSGGTTGNAGYAAQVLALTNAERAKAGCKALTSNGTLTSVAQAHSADMATHNYFSHTSQDGRSPFDRMRAAGYDFRAAAENIAMGQPTPADVMTAWMNSPGHKANILNCTYAQIGLGYAVGHGSPYWTQDFGTPL